MIALDFDEQKRVLVDFGALEMDLLESVVADLPRTGSVNLDLFEPVVPDLVSVIGKCLGLDPGDCMYNDNRERRNFAANSNYCSGPAVGGN